MHAESSAPLSSTPDLPAAAGAFDLIVIGGSAGGLFASSVVLRDLPRQLPVPLLLMLHLPPESELVAVYERLPMKVCWVRDGLRLQPGMLRVCPPRAFVEVLPDGSCRVTDCARGALDKPIDRLFDSVARSFGRRAMGVMLSGMGADGAAGALELHLAGGRVLAQSPSSAEYPDMPRAAIEAGAADVVVPLTDIGQVLAEMHAGTPRPQARSELRAIERVFGAQGDVAACARALDWSATPLGPVVGWPDELRVMARTAMESPSPVAIFWGEASVQLFNDAWALCLGHPARDGVLGAPAHDTRKELWTIIGPMLDRVRARGHASDADDHFLLIERGGALEEACFAFSYAAIRDAQGEVVGVHCSAWDTTGNVVAERRMRALRALAATVAGAATPREACALAAQSLAGDPADVPFALFYLLDETRQQAALAGAAGVEPGSPPAPHVLPARHACLQWPLAPLLADEIGDEGRRVRVGELAARVPEPAPGPPGAVPPQSPREALMLPLRSTLDRRPLGMLVVALTPHRPFDSGYRNFIDLVAQQVNAGIGQARARQLEHERLERFAELDRAKTEFFSNVSHEFRTPLTLLLAPLEELLGRRDTLAADVGERLALAERNGRRLLRLVNNLLDFSQMESQRRLPGLEPVDLAAHTADIASVFRSAIEAAGLALRVELAPDLAPVPVNRDMWEKVVSNLLSNALKFTFQGEICVRVRSLQLHAVLEVSDTGVGIPAAELPHLFKRFHRVHGTRARTSEGSGIGLSIVHDLVNRMGGQVSVSSRVGAGTTFTVWLPFKSRRQAEPAPAGPAAARVSSPAADLAGEAARWLARPAQAPVPEAHAALPELPEPPEAAGGPAGRLLVAEDNADLREYLHRLLSPRWRVQLAGSGREALACVRAQAPDVVLADVMMADMDGLELLAALHAEPQLAQVPVILLSARAGEEATVQALQAGAEDYVAKPFSPRELLARVQAACARARARSARPPGFSQGSSQGA